MIDEECGYIINLGVDLKLNHWVKSLKELIDDKYDAVFVGAGAPLPDARRRHPGRQEAAAHIHIGIDWLANVAFGHTTKIAKRVIVLGGGNTAMVAAVRRAVWAARTSRSSCVAVSAE